MPELPEVETIKRQLNKSLIGKKIKKVEVFTPRYLDIKPQKFIDGVSGQRIKKVRRRAKLIIIDLSSDRSLIIHLKMTGQLLLGTKLPLRNLVVPKSADKISKYTHLIYIFTDNTYLIQNDLRKFGWVKLIKTSEVERYLQKEKYGPEPLEKTFTLNVFEKIIKSKPRQKIKQFLMNQKNIAGIGNLYADEICFCAKVKPTRINKTLKKGEIVKIYKCIKNVLIKAIKYRGSSINNYLDAGGESGNYTQHLKVYDREGEKCPNCGSIIKKIKLSGRGTHFCPGCQK